MTDIPHHNTAEPQRGLEPSDVPAGATRRSVIATLGGATLGVAALGLAATQATAAMEHRAAARPAAACVLAPEQTEGPYYLDLETVRKDITEGKAGVALTLRVTVVDAATCAPLPGGGRHLALRRPRCLLRLCRWWFHPGHHLPARRAADRARPESEFTTVYPGWYVGRAFHIHVKTHVGGHVSNGTYHGGHVSHTGQLYFPEAYNTRIAPCPRTGTTRSPAPSTRGTASTGTGDPPTLPADPLPGRQRSRQGSDRNRRTRHRPRHHPLTHLDACGGRPCHGVGHRTRDCGRTAPAEADPRSLRRDTWLKAMVSPGRYGQETGMSRSRTCDVCGATLIVSPHGGRPARYCSSACPAAGGSGDGRLRVSRLQDLDGRGERPAAGARLLQVGRQHELSALRTLLRSSHLLALTGAGGVGKTRLALEFAKGLPKRFARVDLVELASLQDSTLVTQSVAAALGVGERAGRTGVDVLVRAIGDASRVLMDNCEHLAEPCARLAAILLGRCPVCGSWPPAGRLWCRRDRVPGRRAVPAARPTPETMRRPSCSPMPYGSSSTAPRATPRGSR